MEQGQVLECGRFGHHRRLRRLAYEADWIKYGLFGAEYSMCSGPLGAHERLAAEHLRRVVCYVELSMPGRALWFVTSGILHTHAYAS